MLPITVGQNLIGVTSAAKDKVTGAVSDIN
jgi:hypothetical protein